MRLPEKPVDRFSYGGRTRNAVPRSIPLKPGNLLGVRSMIVLMGSLAARIEGCGSRIARLCIAIQDSMASEITAFRVRPLRSPIASNACSSSRLKSTAIFTASS
jgi:hypothetical protein